MMMQNTWLLADMAECQREDAMDRAEQYRLCKLVANASKVGEWMQAATMLLAGLLALIIQPRG